MKQILKYFVLSFVILLAGCTSVQNGDSKNIAQYSSPYVAELQKSKPSTESNASYYARIGKEMVDKKEDPFKVLEVYKKLVTLFSAKSDERQKVLRYILDENLKMVTLKKGQDALKMALELDKLIPKDFYVQNRIIGAYRVLAEEQADRNNLEGAMQLTQKGLQIRFDPDIMRTQLDIEILMAKQAIRNNKPNEAKTKLNDIISIADAQDDLKLFAKEKGEAQKLLATIK